MKSLKNEKLINELFECGKSISSPLVFAKVLDSKPGCVFAVSSKKFKRSVDRNRIKRLMRECVKDKNIDRSIAFIYTGNELPTLSQIKESINKIFTKIL